MVGIKPDSLELLILIERSSLNFSDPVATEVEDLEIRETRKCILVDCSDLVVIEFQANQVWQTDQGIFLHTLDHISADVDRVQRVDHLDSIGNLVDFVLKEVQIFYVGAVHKGLLVNCRNGVVF